tara:strand:+ start:357 stop:542 length:186 start_codon:yes stop_codon:yes gene_type:complete
MNKKTQEKKKKNDYVYFQSCINAEKIISKRRKYTQTLLKNVKAKSMSVEQAVILIEQEYKN